MLRDCFHLRAEPFGLTPDLRFVFNLGEFERVGYAMLASCRQGDAVAVLSAPPGCGKTLLLRWLVAQLGEQVRSEVVWAPDLDFADLHSLLMAEVGAGDDDGYPGSRSGSSRSALRPVLLLDEADKLSDEVLSGLAAFLDAQRDQLPFRGVVLTGAEDFFARLDGLGFGGFSKEWALSPLRADQIHAYVSHRLQIADYRGGGLFSAEAIDRLAVLSQGIPRIINTLCSRALVALCVGTEEQVSAGILNSVSRDESFAAPAVALSPTLQAGNSNAEPGAVERRNEVRRWGETPPAAVHEAGGGRDTQLTPVRGRRARATRSTCRRRDGRVRRSLRISAAGLLAVIVVSMAAFFVVRRNDVSKSIVEVDLELPGRRLSGFRNEYDGRAGVLGRAAHAGISAPITITEPDPQLEFPTSTNLAAQPRQTAPETSRGSTVTTSTRVVRAQFTSGISSREPIDVTGPVVMADEIKRLYFFTELNGLRGETVTHRWVYDGKIMAEVPFRVRGNSWRAFSRKDLTLAMTGLWQVLVTDSKDNLLAAAHFRYDAR